eukprot:GHVU01086210.1.p2 GENE.GHVU01086210.1~~GHVU01086210.1.p2  ORF type:complete len:104 (-),score=7.40 GHVU01086210.1:111-422(-)
MEGLGCCEEAIVPLCLLVCVWVWACAYCSACVCARVRLCVRILPPSLCLCVCVRRQVVNGTGLYFVHRRVSSPSRAGTDEVEVAKLVGILEGIAGFASTATLT